jgi:D-sedoheptulose 7-phosphate isomerase
MMQSVHSRIFGDALAAHGRTFAAVAELGQSFGLAAELCGAAIANGNCIMLCGNGGSAADAQHAAAELTGRFRRERRGLPAVALTTDTSALTAIGNDYGFEQVFARQVEALGRPGDVLIAISSSGNSPNLIAAVERAAGIGMRTIALAGRDGGRIAALSEVALVIPAAETARIQEAHIFLLHCLCEFVEESVM